MAGFDYGRSRATAERLIKRFGQSAVLRRSTVGAGHNPSAPTQTDYAVQIMVSEYAVYHRDGTVIKAGDKKVIVSTEGLSVEPVTTDKLLIESVVHSVVAVDKLSPGGTAVMFTLQCRR